MVRGFASYKVEIIWAPSDWNVLEQELLFLFGSFGGVVLKCLKPFFGGYLAQG